MPVFTMTVLAERAESVTLGVRGNVCRESLAPLQRFIASAQRQKRVVLDLSEVTLLDHAAASFFSERLERGVDLINCPPYLRHWIFQEISHAPER